MKKYDAVIAGYICADLTPDISRSHQDFVSKLLPGKLLEVGPCHISLGGVVPNTGIAMHRLGATVNLQGLVGNDALGQLVLNELKAKGCETDNIRTHDKGTAYSIVITTTDQDRTFLEFPGTNAYFNLSALNMDDIAQSRLFHLGYPPLMEKLFADNGRELISLMKEIHHLNVITSMDMAVPDPDSPAGKMDWQAILAGVLPYTTVFVPSLEEIAYMLLPGDYAEWTACAEDGNIIDLIPEQVIADLGKELIEMGASVVMIKAGHRGAYLRTGSSSERNASINISPSSAQWINSEPVDPKRYVNAIGAGDAAVAGFLSSLLDHDPIETAAKKAMTAGRDSLYGIDAVSGLT